MRKQTWKVVCAGAPVLVLALLGLPRIQAAAVSTTQGQAAQVFQRKLYTATISPTNGSGVTGTVRVVLDGDRLGVDLDATGLDPNIPHPQFIRTGTACPTSTDDTNGDGLVDAIEVNSPSGPPILPLTLSGLPLQITQSSPAPVTSASPSASPSASASAAPSVPVLSEDFPLPSPSGHLTYIQSFGVEVVQAAFPPTPSASPSSSASPIASSSPSASPSASASPGGFGAVDLTNRVITIHGFAPGSFLQLPSTLGTILGLPSEASLPVACGVLSEQSE